MTATIGTSANLSTGLREFNMVTNTYAGYLQSASVAYDLVLPFQPDKFEWWNYSKFGTNDNNISGVWFRDFPSGDSLIVRRGTTTLTSTLETTNGVTLVVTPAAFTDQHVTITGITTATPAVVTAAGHGLSDGDRVVITKVVGTIGPEVNNQTFVVDVLSSSTFALYDIYGVAITTVGTYTSGGQLTKTGPDLNVVNNPAIYELTLGSAIMGADNDVIYFVASSFNSYYNLGDVA
jgi:hypothetical protein